MTEEKVLKVLRLVYRLQARLEMSDYENLATGSSQARILEYVLNNPGIPHAVVIERMNLNRTTISQIVRRLVTCDYLERKRSPRDRRQFLLYPSPMAKAFRKLFIWSVEDRQAVMLKDFTTEEKNKLERLLTRIAANTATELRDRRMR